MEEASISDSREESDLAASVSGTATDSFPPTESDCPIYASATFYERAGIHKENIDCIIVINCGFIDLHAALGRGAGIFAADVKFASVTGSFFFELLDAG
jgi:hypothetical protein